MKQPEDAYAVGYGTGQEHRAILPVGSNASVRAYVRLLLRRHRRAFGLVVGLEAVAALASLVGPAVLGRLVGGLAQGTGLGQVNRAAGVFVVALIIQTVFTRASRLRAALLGETALADLREDFLTRAVDLPPSVIERAGTGDLLSRTTTDIDRLSFAVREAVPQIAITLVTAVLVVGALVVTSPLLALAALVAVPALLTGSRWYFRRAPQAYRAETATYAAVNAVVAETVDAGRTVEAYGLGSRRVAQTDAAIHRWIAWERYTLWLRSAWFPSVDGAYVAMLLAVLGFGSWLLTGGHISVAQLTAGVLYTQMLVEPLDMLLMWYDELQVGTASLARLVGVREVPSALGDPTLTPDGGELIVDDVSFAYSEGRDVLHQVSLDVPVGSTVALVGPSGAGKSTLGRLLAGTYRPRLGAVTLGGAALADMPAERVRREVALVTQEHHVFVGSLRDNLRLADPLADDDALWRALTAVDAQPWVAALTDGLETTVGSGGLALTPAQAQQVALARLVLADPHTLVLDEATSLLDPRAARHLERSLATVLHGRTVIAIAHRLSTAHDADRIAVVEDGRISELGSHDELVAAGGAYAELWHSWRSTD